MKHLQLSERTVFRKVFVPNRDENKQAITKCRASYFLDVTFFCSSSEI
jgi:hypothetical protein